MASLQDKAVLVTGAGAGIGRATALAMAAEGAVIAAADIDLAAAERTAAQVSIASYNRPTIQLTVVR